MKKIIKTTILLLALLVPVTALAQSQYYVYCDFEVNGICYNVNGQEAEVTFSYCFEDSEFGVLYYSSFYSGEITIPPIVVYEGTTYPVTSINKRTFSDCSGLTSVTIPNSVKSIGDEAFYGCDGLTSITVPNSVTSIGDRAFDSTPWYQKQPDGLVYAGLVAYKYKGTMPSGTSITIKNGTASISPSAFYNCSGLTSIDIPNSVTSIGDGAFYECTNLTSIEIPNSVTSIGGWAFEFCSGLTSVNIGNSVTTIGDGAFFNCSSLSSVAIPRAVTFIGTDAFNGCTALKTLDFNAILCSDFLHYELLTYEKAPFYNLNITSINIGEQVQKIPAYFALCLKELTSITIPNSVTSFGNEAFYGCSALTNVSIPNSVTSIGISAFSNCSGLTSVTIPNSVTSIGGSAFSGCSGLTSVTIPNSVTSIGNYTFYDCSGLTSVTIPNSVTSIAHDAFNGCSGLTSVTIPNSVTEIGSNAFTRCSGLTDLIWDVRNCSSNGNMSTTNIEHVTIGNEVEVLPSNFVRGSKITSVAIPNSVTSIGSSAFQGCSGLIGITIPNSVKFINQEAFYGCSGLASVTIPNSVTSIGKNAFKDCTGLNRVNISDLAAWCRINFETAYTNPLCYAQHLYLNDNELTDLVVPNDVEAIGDYTFYNCSLTSVKLHQSVTSVGKQAFNNSSTIETVTCAAETPPSWDDIAMFTTNVYNHTPLYVPIGSERTYMADQCWGQFATIIGTNIHDGSDIEDFEVDGIYYHALAEDMAMVIKHPEMDNYYSGDVVIPESVTYQDMQFAVVAIDDGAFEDCYDLNSVVIGNAVETIGEEAFVGCTGLTRVTIGKGVTYIGVKAFNYCNALQTVACRGTVPPVMASINCFSTAAYNRAQLLVPRNCIETYQAADYWYRFASIEGWGSLGPGDVNGDGCIDVNDVTMAIAYVLGNPVSSSFDFEYADINGNGRIDVVDITAIISLILNGW